MMTSRSPTAVDEQFYGLRKNLARWFPAGCLLFALGDILFTHGPAAANLVPVVLSLLAFVAVRFGVRPDRVLSVFCVLSGVALLSSVARGIHPPAALIWIVSLPLVAALLGSLPLIVSSLVLGVGGVWVTARFTDSLSTTHQVTENVTILMVVMTGLAIYYWFWRQRVLASLSDLAADFESVVLRQPVGTMVVRSGKIAFANREADTLLSASSRARTSEDVSRETGELVGRSIEEFLPSIEAPSSSLALGARRLRVESQAIRFGGAGSALLTVLDDTRVLEAQRSRLEHEVAMHRVQRLELVGQLAGGIAHDFNNLLTTILASADLLLDQLQASRDQPESSIAVLRDIRQAGVEAAERVRQLLAYSGRGIVFSERIDVDLSTLDIVRLFHARSVARGVRLSSPSIASGAKVMLDASRFQLVLANVINNAIRAARLGGSSVEVSSRLVSLSGEDLAGDLVAGSTAVAGDFVEVSVVDDGVGIPPDDRERIMEPYFSNWAQASGLGLAAVSGILRDCRGALLLESEPGQGSCFRVVLPLAGEWDLRDDEPRVAAKSRRVLVVEDDVQALGLVRQLLERVGHEVLGAIDRVEALRLWEERSDSIDILICDYLLPEGSGLEVVKRMRESRPELPVIVISGLRLTDGDLPSDVELLIKPFDAAELVAMISRL